jgi:hypothetical protein
MILDIRHLQLAPDAEDPPEAGQEKAEPQAAENPKAPESSCSPDLEDLLNAACSEDAGERAEAIAQLRALVPSREGADYLGGIVEDAADTRRLTAAQLLGFHRGWLAARSGAERLTGWVRNETDPEVGRALVWALRGRTEVREFLLHRVPGIAREAALGLPVRKETAPALVSAVLAGCARDVETILLDKLRTAPGSLAATISELVVEWVGSASEEAILALVACLPQVEIFEHFVEKRGVPTFDPRAGEEATEMLRRWHRLARMVETAMLEEPSAELVRHLVGRCARDDAFARRHASFLTAAIANTGATFGSELLRDLERLAIAASEERLVKMAGMLLELKARLDRRAEPEAEELLEGWKGRSPALKLKIYHMQQGLD